MSWVFYYNEQKKVCNVPLKDIKYTYNVHEDAYECVCIQEYENNCDVPIETYYKYPAYCGASLVGVVVKTDEYELICDVKEKEEAKQEYKEAVANGDQAVLVSEDTEEQYDIKIGNMKPHQIMKVELTYLCELEYDNQHNGFKVILPLTITPRYDPKMGCLNANTTDGVQYSDNVNYVVSELKLNVNLRSTLDDVVCISHQYRMLGTKETTHGEYTMTNITPDKDVIFIIKTCLSENYAYQVGDVLKVHINQQLEVDRLQQELANTDVCENIFVLDQSGSMYGFNCESKQIVIASQLVKDMIGNLKCGKDYFNYYRFGSSFKKLLPHSVLLDEKSIVQAVSYIDANTPNDMGGTETFTPLKDIFDTPKPTGIHKRNIMLITDGEITNIDEVAKLCRSDGETNMFVVGIGNGISHLFCKALTDEGYGYSTMISTNDGDCTKENISGKAKEMVQRMLSKANDMEFVIDGKSMKKERFQHIVNLNRYFKVDHVCKEIDVIVNDNHTLIFVGNESMSNGFTPTERFYYKKEINSLENKTYYGNQCEKDLAKTKETLIELSKKYKILTRFTSFIGVKKMSEKINECVSMEVPLQTPTKYQGSSSSVSMSNGALVVSGGVGICKCVQSGGNHPTMYMDCATKTYVDSVSSGAITISGGIVGVSGKLYCGMGGISFDGYRPSYKPIGVNTIGSSHKNASYELNNSPPLPKFVASPWMQSNNSNIETVNNIQQKITITENIDLTKWYELLSSYGIHKMFIMSGFIVILSGQTNQAENGTYTVTDVKPLDTVKYYQYEVSPTEIYYLVLE